MPGEEDVAVTWPELLAILWTRHNFSFAGGATLFTLLLAIFRCIRNLRARVYACVAWLLVAVLIWLLCFRERAPYLSESDG
jgi:hypothetical protein